MQTISIVVIVVVTTYFLFELVALVIDARRPSKRYEEEDPVLGKTAIICGRFSAADDANLCTGRVEINGTIWMAETVNDGRHIEIGDRYRVTGRDGLRLIVEAECSPTDHPRAEN